MTALLLFTLRFKPVQTYLAQKATNYLSNELGTKVSLDGIYIVPFKSIVIEKLLVLDQQKDTLASFPKFTIDINKLSIKERQLRVKKIWIDSGQFFLKDYPNHATNLDFIIDYFDKPSVKPKVKKKKFELYFQKITLQNLNFKYKNLRHIHTSEGINFEDIEAQNLNVELENLTNTSHLLNAEIKNISLKEKSGFKLNKLAGQLIFDKKFIEIKDLEILTDRTRIRDYYRMDFKSGKDFKDYENKIKMTTNFKDSHLSSYDIAFFVPSLKKIKLDLDLNGSIKGAVNDLRAKNLMIKAGRATFVKGDFNLKGLPHWNDTFIDAKVDLAGTNKKDLDEILTDISGKTIKHVPEIISKFGNINFNGYFTGFQNDFIAYGEFKTQLGRLNSDVNMKIDKDGVPTYQGNLKSFDFNIGEILHQKLLGKITSTLTIKGRGTELEKLKEDLKGDISYLDFKGYRYRNLTVNGLFEKKFFDGNLKIRDKNVSLDFDGTVNFNPELPIFHFNANLQNAQLKTLNLYKDSLLVDARFKTNFSGKNLDNIQGLLALQHIQLKNSSGDYHIDSVALIAKGMGADRSLAINSDILEAKIHGQYDLNSIVSYMKSIVKKYVPSLKTPIFAFKPQAFDFQLKIKNFAPLANFISPTLEIQENSMLAGNFNSTENSVTLGGIIKQLKYKGITAQNIIIDQSTTARQLTAIVTSDKVNFNDSLYIKNVNISNILRNDSLALNIKLSNEDDANQLDLNGLSEFFTDTTKISILPSNLKINSEDWHIQDKVQIGFNEGKTKIEHFSLSQGKQELKIDGIISNDPKDLLVIGLANIKLQTFNPFLKSAKINLQGTANGQTQVFGVLKEPIIKNNFSLDSLGFNQVYIGNLTDTSSYNSVSKQINVFTKIHSDQKETLNIKGGIDLIRKNIDIKAILEDTKLMILNPFLSHLISNIDGSITANLDINGNFNNPQINGDIKLNKGQFTVNYLKSTFIIDDKINVKNTNLLLSNLVLKDIEGHKGIANGNVDLKNINTPHINVVVNADHLLALNTSSRDNSLYYGKAYGTGRFSFTGPTNDMLIDIDARTEKGTVFNLPLNNSEKISDKDFITFVSKDTTKIVERKTSFNGLTMNLKLKINPNTTANIYTILGKLSGTGNAELEMNISKVGDFEMKGDYNIENGAFDFTAREVINKRFEIRQGGNIRWTGNALNAQINLKAFYSLRTPLGDLYQAANRDGSNNANLNAVTEVEMGLTNLLMKPDIKLDIFFPANPAVKEELQSYFNDGNNLYSQALSLIVQRKFAPGTGKDNLSQQLGKVGEGTATDLVFNQLNNVLSTLNLNFVDLNIRSLNEASASFKFFNDRIVVNAGITDLSKKTNDNTQNLQNERGTELEVLGLIKKDGSLVGKIANKPPTIQSIFANPGIDPYKNIFSLGLTYSQQFDSFREFLHKITGKHKNDTPKKENRSNTPKNLEAIIERSELEK